MTAPDIRRFVAVCTGCRHWQVDVRPGAVSDLGGAQAAMWAIGEAKADHDAECPGAGGGRVNVLGQWIEPPKMADGKPSTGSLEMHPLPRWWVAR